jgi:hypothetical protein
MFKLAGYIFTAGVLIGIGAVIFVSCSGDKVVNSLFKGQNESAITKKQFKSVPLGTTKANLINRFGQPNRKTRVKTNGIYFKCFVYNLKNQPLQSTDLRFCFLGNELNYKRSS